ncbi:MAG: putative DNA-binding protein (MmcQ/YjbR family) [Thalassomonas sp.]|jgi:predicted DNA-binding protein (MmcQ/YjbR family)
MTLDHFREHCLSLKGTTEELPFNENTLVFKVLGKMFALCNMMTFEFTKLKCDTEKAITLREEYTQVTPAWHMNKKHWNSVSFMGDLSDKQIENWVEDSYNLVLKNIPKKLKLELDKF